MVQAHPGNFAAAKPGWEDIAAGRTEIGPAVGLMFGNRVAVTVEVLGMNLAVARGTADRLDLPGCVQLHPVEHEVALGKESGHSVVLVEIGSRGFAGLGEELGQAGHNMVPGLGKHSSLDPVVHKNPSKQQ